MNFSHQCCDTKRPPPGFQVENAEAAPLSVRCTPQSLQQTLRTPVTPGILANEDFDFDFHLQASYLSAS